MRPVKDPGCLRSFSDGKCFICFSKFSRLWWSLLWSWVFSYRLSTDFRVGLVTNHIQYSQSRNRLWGTLLGNWNPQSPLIIIEMRLDLKVGARQFKLYCSFVFRQTVSWREFCPSWRSIPSNHSLFKADEFWQNRTYSACAFRSRKASWLLPGDYSHPPARPAALWTEWLWRWIARWCHLLFYWQSLHITQPNCVSSWAPSFGCLSMCFLGARVLCISNLFMNLLHRIWCWDGGDFGYGNALLYFFSFGLWNSVESEKCLEGFCSGGMWWQSAPFSFHAWRSVQLTFFVLDFGKAIVSSCSYVQI